LEERQGASSDAWLDPAKWARFADGLRAKIEKEAAQQPAPFDGCFVGTAMNHRAAMFTEIAERPITAAAAVTALRAGLAQFRARSGELYERMMAHPWNTPGSSYPLARITAMHAFRLAAVLELMFAPGARLYFARNGSGANGRPMDCEWTVGAFAAELEARASGAKSARLLSHPVTADVQTMTSKEAGTAAAAAPGPGPGAAGAYPAAAAQKLESENEAAAFRAVVADDAAALAKLLSEGVDKDARNKGGHTLLELATERRRAACATALKEQGAFMDGSSLTIGDGKFDRGAQPQPKQTVKATQATAPAPASTGTGKAAAICTWQTMGAVIAVAAVVVAVVSRRK
jgi:hypothetical protein